MANEEQTDELDALKSIYDGDPDLTFLSNTSFQYLFGTRDTPKSFLLQITWPIGYPNVSPQFSMDLFYNSHVIKRVKEIVLEILDNEVSALEGMAMTYTLIEKVKEELDHILQLQPETIAPEHKEKDNIDVEDAVDTDNNITERNTQMTKAQKRRMWDKGNANEGRTRGWDWVCIIRHLSQTGPAQN